MSSFISLSSWAAPSIRNVPTTKKHVGGQSTYSPSGIINFPEDFSRATFKFLDDGSDIPLTPKATQIYRKLLLSKTHAERVVTLGQYDNAQFVRLIQAAVEVNEETGVLNERVKLNIGEVPVDSVEDTTEFLNRFPRGAPRVTVEGLDSSLPFYLVNFIDANMARVAYEDDLLDYLLGRTPELSVSHVLAGDFFLSNFQGESFDVLFRRWDRILLKVDGLSSVHPEIYELTLAEKVFLDRREKRRVLLESRIALLEGAKLHYPIKREMPGFRLPSLSDLREHQLKNCRENLSGH